MQADEQLVAAKAALQHELLALKSQHSDRFHLHRAHSGPDAPFPVIASLHVEKPPAAEAYDIFNTIQIRVTIQISALSQVRTEAASGLTVEVRSSELPLRLREYIAQRLYNGWKPRHLGGVSGNGGLQLGLLLQGAKDQYLELLSGLQGCTEAYEGTSASGATLRRFVIIQDSVADASAANSHDPPANDSANPSHSMVSAPAVEPPTVHGLDRDVVWARRKYGAQACQLLRCVGGDDGESAPLVCLRLEMQPTDPAWTTQDGRLLLDFTVGSSYPTAGSLAVSVQPISSCGVSELGLKLLSRIWSAEASGLASPVQRPSRAASPLKLLILSIENGAGEAVRQVEQAFARQNADAMKPSAEIGDASVLPDSSSGNEEEGGKSWRHRVGAGLWWPCVAGSDAISVRATALPPMPEQSDASDSDLQSGSDSSTPLSGSEGARSEGEEEDVRNRTDKQARLPAPGARTAVELHLDGLRVSNIDAMELHSLNLQVSCQRCGQAEAVRLAPGEATSRQPESRTEGDCSKCHANWAVVLQLRHVHDTSNVLGLLWPSGCTLQDLLPSILQVQCSSCSASGAIRQVMVGSTAERACSHCHSSLSVHFSGATFVPRSSVPPRSRQLRRRRRNGSDGGSDGGVESAALADRGTCKHYKHSYRWLRFPCCGARFACDLCHEEATDGHHIKWATQMICGFCSREQPLGTHCSFCHRRLSSGSGAATTAKSHFWEGGLGCRDKSRLDSRDSHKYTNSKLKTQSKRSERVGQRGKQLREQRQAANGD